MTQSSLLLSDDLSICTSRDGNCLWVLVRSHQIPHRPATVALIRQRLRKLDVRSVRWVRILGHQAGRRSPVWSHEIDLWREASLTAVERATLATSMVSRRAARKHFRTWMLGVSVPASLLGAHWFSEVVGLTSEDTSEFPLGEATRFTSSDVTDLETAEPKPAAPEMPLSLPWFNRYERGLERALAAAELGQTARSPEAWAAVAERWEQAIAAMESVPATSPEFIQAQEKITEYQHNLEYVEQQPDYYREAIAHAIEAVELGKQATTRPQWQAATDGWQRAIAALQAVEPTHDAYAEAQGRIPVYQRYLDYTRSQAETSSMTLLKTLRGKLSPKSISTSGQGTFFVSNGIQRHSIAVFDRSYNPIANISDAVNLDDYGHAEFPGIYQGAPADVAFSSDGAHIWVANTQMHQAGARSPEGYGCGHSPRSYTSFLYRLDAATLQPDRTIPVGAGARFVAASPDGRLVLTSNWCSGDVSVVDTAQDREIYRLPLGMHPNGIAVDAGSTTAYVAIAGSTAIATVNLQDFSVGWLNSIGISPHFILLDPSGQYLYASVEGESKVVRIDLQTGDRAQVFVGESPRGMALSADGSFLYVANYLTHTLSKIRTSDLEVIQTQKTNPSPTSIAYDPETRQVWVSCASGSVQVFQD